MVADDGASKEALMSAMVTVHGTRQPALQAALQVALYGATAAEREAAEHVVQAFCSGNSDGQQMLASTMMPVESLDPGDPGGATPKERFHTLILLRPPSPAVNIESDAEMTQLQSLPAHIRSSFMCRQAISMLRQLRAPESVYYWGLTGNA